ncbi:MAG: hypothetical protein ABMA00_20200, partial [Gemmatimonas sp.]
MLTAGGGLLCAACAGGTALPSLPTGSIGLSVPAAGEPSRFALPSAEIYARIARGANRCWFGPRGRISATHLLHADADSPANGGAVEIVVHERAVDQPKPWGYKAFRIALTESASLDGTPGAGGTSIDVQNTRIAEAEATRMRAEVFHWAGGNEGCKPAPALDKPTETAAALAQPPTSAKSATRKVRPKAASAG